MPDRWKRNEKKKRVATVELSASEARGWRVNIVIGGKIVGTKWYKTYAAARSAYVRL